MRARDSAKLSFRLAKAFFVIFVIIVSFDIIVIPYNKYWIMVINNILYFLSYRIKCFPRGTTSFPFHQFLTEEGKSIQSFGW